MKGPRGLARAKSPEVFRPPADAARVPEGRGPSGQPPGLQRVRELVSARTEDSATFALSDGSFETSFTTGPMHFRQADGSWRRIDITLVADPGGDGAGWRPKATGYDLRLPGRLSDGPARVERDGHWLRFALDDGDATGAFDEPAATAEGSTASYRVAEGVKVAVTARADSVKEEVVLAGPQAPRRFTWTLRADAGLSAVLHDG